MSTEEAPASAIRALFTVLLVMLGFSVFFLTFLTVPLALLALFYIGFSLRSRRGQRRSASTPRPVAIVVDPSVPKHLPWH